MSSPDRVPESSPGEAKILFCFDKKGTTEIWYSRGPSSFQEKLDPFILDTWCNYEVGVWGGSAGIVQVDTITLWWESSQLVRNHFYKKYHRECWGHFCHQLQLHTSKFKMDSKGARKWRTCIHSVTFFVITNKINKAQKANIEAACYLKSRNVGRYQWTLTKLHATATRTARAKMIWFGWHGMAPFLWYIM